MCVCFCVIHNAFSAQCILRELTSTNEILQVCGVSRAKDTKRNKQEHTTAAHPFFWPETEAGKDIPAPRANLLFLMGGTEGGGVKYGAGFFWWTGYEIENRERVRAYLNIVIGKGPVFMNFLGRKRGERHIYATEFICGPPNCPFLTHFKSSFEAPPRKKNLVPQNGAYGEHFKGSFEAPQNLVSKGPISGGRKWTHGGPQMNASNS